MFISLLRARQGTSIFLSARPLGARCASTLSVRATKVVPTHSKPLRARSEGVPTAADAFGRLAFDASKAGLQGVDKAYVQQVIAKATRGSAFYESEQRKEAARMLRNNLLLQRLKAFRGLTAKEKRLWQSKAKLAEAELEAERDFSRCFIHIDLDMFYAAVEEKHDPSLREHPFAVGTYAMLSTSNYLARQFGVRSGMPGFIAKKLCPQLWIQPAHFDLYRQEAAAVRAIASRYDSNYFTVGLDEMTLDVTDYLRKNPSLTASGVCQEFRHAVEEETKLTCSGGVSHTAAFAKLASNVNKPNGQHCITLKTREEVLAYVRDMPVRDVPGVGLATEQQLCALGIHTCADFLRYSAELCYLFRPKTFTFYLSAGLGLVRTRVDRIIAERTVTAPSGKLISGPALSVTVSDDETPSEDRKPSHIGGSSQHKASSAARKKNGPSFGGGGEATSAEVHPQPALKSTGKCITSARGFKTQNAFWQRLHSLSESAHAVMKEQGCRTKHICFRSMNRAFEAHSCSTTLPTATDSFPDLYESLAALAKPTAPLHRQLRLIGVTFQKLQKIDAPSCPSAASDTAFDHTPAFAKVRQRCATPTTETREVKTKRTTKLAQTSLTAKKRIRNMKERLVTQQERPTPAHRLASATARTMQRKSRVVPRRQV